MNIQNKRVIATMPLLLISVCMTVSAVAGNWLKYTFKDRGFSIACPEGWNVIEHKEGALTGMVSVVLPKKTVSRKFRANMAIMSAEQDNPPLALEKFYRRNIDAMSASPDFPEFKQENLYKIKLNGRNAYQTTFTYQHPTLKLKLKSFQIYSMSDSRLYVIQYAASKATYKKYMDDVNAIVRSFTME